MDEVIRSRMQALEGGDKAMVSTIMDAIDAALAFVLQVEEIIKSTYNEDDEEARTGELEAPLERSSSKDFQGLDKDAAFNVAVDELEELQLSLLEAARLTRLDSIQEQDAQLARSLSYFPGQERNRARDLNKNPTHDSSDVDIYEIVLSLLSDGAKESAEQVIRELKRAKASSTPLTIREGKPLVSSTGKGTKTKTPTGKGKEKVPEEDDDSIYFDLPLSSNISELMVAASEPDWETNCQICFDSEHSTSTFVTLEGCGHQFCAKCVTRHAEARVDGGQMNVTCLLDECPAFVSDMQLSSLLSSAMLDILARRQVEAAIPASEILYCPFKDCSALFIKPTSEPSTSAHPPTTCVECEACHRAFCVHCMVPWHGDKSCGEYRADLKNESLQGDEKLLELAKKQKWQRCTKCGRVVDLSYGCNHIKCLCKHEFCFLCGAEMYGEVKKCRCARWEEARL